MSFKAGNVTSNFIHWIAITNDMWVLDNIKGITIELYKLPKLSQHIDSTPSNPQKREEMRKLVNSMLNEKTI